METEAGAADEAARCRPQEATPAPPDPSGTAPTDAAGASDGSDAAEASDGSDAAEAHDGSAPAERRGITALSPGYRMIAALALAGVAVVAGVHILMVFLHVAPSNTLSKRHSAQVEAWIYPEFEQNWKLFAPNPLQQNVAVQARAEVRVPGGELRTTRWYDLSGQDGAAIDGNLLPSHTQQNELRRAWDIYVSTHDTQNRPNGLRGTLSEQYLRRVLVLRLDRLDVAGAGDIVERVQVRSRSTVVEPPKWSDEKVNQKPFYRQVPWWTVTSRDASLDSGTHLRVEAATGGAR
ncbi:DUF5819 family protein [Streptomyces kunmingensis]|uniref:DUF5819 family protein n=1 Tax=Streptomyces kunmingensis TaxID=68225 RepID=A0ABU6CMC3_9ACTN|nr:DUF5819 family protein [Streptomyces kunmingensis]MEB3965879.1 DUF5819 family protein [Streptomyces kunmingensis]